MMTYREFCIEIAPTVLELENECRGMTREEFKCFRDDVMQTVAKSDLSLRFMEAVLEMIYHHIFGVNISSKSEVA